MELPGDQVPSIDELRKRISTIEQKTPPKGDLGSINVSEEELKIRDELEEEVERSLEEEIKGQICQLSLRLSRLYQRRKERISARRGHDDHRQEKSFSEVKISIKMEGGTTIKINETKIPESREIKARPHYRAPSESGASHHAAPLSGKRFDWARTLRSS